MADSSFDVTAPREQETGSTLVVGQSHVGLAGVTAADYLVRNLDSTQIGHVSPADLPAIAPFQNGTPRHHSRLYTLADADLSVLVGELFIPVQAARSYADALLEWAETQGVDEIAVLHGIPFQHGPDEHTVFHVATDAYRENRLPEGVFNPLQGGFLDGVVGELLTHSLDDGAPDVGVYVTPAHPPGPDADASLQLISALESVYGLDVDESELEELSQQVRQYYEQLASRTPPVDEREEPLSGYDFPDDRTYM